MGAEDGGGGGDDPSLDRDPQISPPWPIVSGLPGGCAGVCGAATRPVLPAAVSPSLGPWAGKGREGLKIFYSLLLLLCCVVIVFMVHHKSRPPVGKWCYLHATTRTVRSRWYTSLVKPKLYHHVMSRERPAVNEAMSSRMPMRSNYTDGFTRYW